MARRAGRRLGRSVFVSVVIAIVLALVNTSGPAEARNQGFFPGCDVINSRPTSQTGGFTIGAVNFLGGEEVSVTASAPTTGSPTTVEIELFLTGTVASASIPGTATWIVPGPVSGIVSFLLDAGQATLDINCIPAPPTATPTDTPTATVSDSPTATATDTPTNTPTETQTPDPSVTATTVPTETAIPATEEPIETPTSTATRDTTGGVTELPDTGGAPGSDSDGRGIWLLFALFAAIASGLAGFRVRQVR